MPFTSTHNLQAILASKGVINPLLSVRIILPVTIYIETVLIPARIKINTRLPVPFFVLLHGHAIDIPVVKIPSERDPLSMRRIEIELGLFACGS